MKKLSKTDFATRFLYWMAAGIILMTFIYIFCITFMTVPKANERFADTIIGFLSGTLVATVINYFFGSSTASKSKDQAIETLVDMHKKQPDVTTEQSAEPEAVSPVESKPTEDVKPIESVQLELPFE